MVHRLMLHHGYTTWCMVAPYGSRICQLRQRSTNVVLTVPVRDITCGACLWLRKHAGVPQKFHDDACYTMERHLLEFKHRPRVRLPRLSWCSESAMTLYLFICFVLYFETCLIPNTLDHKHEHKLNNHTKINTALVLARLNSTSTWHCNMAQLHGTIAWHHHIAPSWL